MAATPPTDVGRLTTHVLDTAAGQPARGMRLVLYRRRQDGERTELVTAVTNGDGRCDGPLLDGDSLETGTYELVFEAGDYFDAQGLDLPRPKFLDEVVIRFGISDADAHYHVPLLLSPYGYSTYRGS